MVTSIPKERTIVRGEEFCNGIELAVGVASLGVSWGLRVELTEAFEIIQRELVSKEVQQNVLESTSRYGDEDYPRSLDTTTLPMARKLSR